MDGICVCPLTATVAVPHQLARPRRLAASPSDKPDCPAAFPMPATKSHQLYPAPALPAEHQTEIGHSAIHKTVANVVSRETGGHSPTVLSVTYMHTGHTTPGFNSALSHIASLALQKQFHAFAPTNSTGRTLYLPMNRLLIKLHPPPLRGRQAVVRYGVTSLITVMAKPAACSAKCPILTGARPCTRTSISCIRYPAACRATSCATTVGISCAFARALEPHAPRAAPRQQRPSYR